MWPRIVWLWLFITWTLWSYECSLVSQSCDWLPKSSLPPVCIDGFATNVGPNVVEFCLFQPIIPAPCGHLEHNPLWCASCPPNLGPSVYRIKSSNSSSKQKASSHRGLPRGSKLAHPAVNWRLQIYSKFLVSTPQLYLLQKHIRKDHHISWN